jgi:hypothetical protein
VACRPEALRHSPNMVREFVESENNSGGPRSPSAWVAYQSAVGKGCIGEENPETRAATVAVAAAANTAMNKGEHWAGGAFVDGCRRLVDEADEEHVQLGQISRGATWPKKEIEASKFGGGSATCGCDRVDVRQGGHATRHARRWCRSRSRWALARRW